MRWVTLGRIVVLVAALAGCAPGKDSVDDHALQARLEVQAAEPAPTRNEFVPTPPRADESPDRSAFLLGPEDVLRITVLNKTELDTVQPVRPDGKIAFFPAGDLQAAGRTVEQVRNEIIRRLRAKSGKSYRLGIQDIVDIKVYGHNELETTQTIGPDGSISVLPGGSLHAAGKTVDELSEEITQRVSTLVQKPIVNVSVADYKSQPLFIADPIVNVVTMEINSRRIAVLGAVKTPGIIKLRNATTIMEAISQAGGLSEDSDLRQSIVLQGGKILPVSLERLFKQADLRQNIYLKPNSSIYVASIRYNSAYVIGEVLHAGKVNWEGSISLSEAIALAGGIGPKAKVDHVLIVSGGIAEPTLKLVDLAGILYRGELEKNIPLARGDIVYVPTSPLDTAERYFDFAIKVLQPILASESVVVLGGSVVNTLKGQGGTGTSINLNP